MLIVKNICIKLGISGLIKKDLNAKFICVEDVLKNMNDGIISIVIGGFLAIVTYNIVRHLSRDRNR